VRDVKDGKLLTIYIERELLNKLNRISQETGKSKGLIVEELLKGC
jgi:predicted DNA-binding protein